MIRFRRFTRVLPTTRGLKTGLLCGFTAALSACGPFVSPAPQPVAGGTTTFTSAAIQNCTSVQWTEKLTNSSGEDITNTYVYKYSNYTSSIPKNNDSLAQLHVAKPGDYSIFINPDIEATTVVKISHTYICGKDKSSLIVDQTLVNGTARAITIDYSTKLINTSRP